MVYVYIWVGGTCGIIVAHAVYIMWEELGHCHFLYVLAVSNIVVILTFTRPK